VHLNFEALKRLSAKEMVRGLPCLDDVEQFCDVCMLTKRRQLPFPSSRASEPRRGLSLCMGTCVAR
jgi:hypothetical protein